MEEQVGEQSYVEAFEASSSVVMIDAPSNLAAEGVGSLRSQLIASADTQEITPLAICAPSEATGATFVAVNLAVAMAQARVPTLLIDADMRDPAVQDMIIPPHKVPGLQQYLVGEANRDDVIQESIIPNLSIIYSGGVAANPQELLSGPRFRELVDVCAAEYDLVILDTPPANRSSDSRYVAALAGKSLVVARKDHSLVHDVKTLVEELGRHEVRVIGTVLNEL